MSRLRSGSSAARSEHGEPKGPPARATVGSAPAEAVRAQLIGSAWMMEK